MRRNTNPATGDGGARQKVLYQQSAAQHKRPPPATQVLKLGPLADIEERRS